MDEAEAYEKWGMLFEKAVNYWLGITFNKEHGLWHRLALGYLFLLCNKVKKDYYWRKYIYLRDRKQKNK